MLGGHIESEMIFSERHIPVTDPSVHALPTTTTEASPTTASQSPSTPQADASPNAAENPLVLRVAVGAACAT
jgi:hypothetical protein